MKSLSDIDLNGNRLLNAVNVATHKKAVRIGVIAALLTLLLGGLIYIGIRYRSE